jgi:Predicted membrane protein
MEIFLLLLILVFVIIIHNKSTSNHQATQNSINQLQEKIDTLKSEMNGRPQNVEQPEVPIIKEEIKHEEVISFRETSEIIEEEKIPEEEIQPEIIENVPPIIKEEELSQTEQKIAFSAENRVREVLPPKKSWLENFKENNPDIEKFIGENLINKIGILILVLGISFFVKYAIDKDWINEPARVGIGILAGALVMGIAHRLRKNYSAFSSVFVAGAISIFYFTIGIAFHDYHLFSQTVAFVIMVVITIFSVFVSVSYDRKELAVLSLIGGFAVPFMVSTGEGNYKILFTYIAILNIGMLMIAYFKKWNLVTFLAFIFSCLLYSAWFGKGFYEDRLPYRGALLFVTIFYIIFNVATVIHNLRNKGTFTKLEYFIMVANTFFYFGMGISIIENWKPEFKGLFTVALALFNLVYAIFLYRKFGLDKNAIYLLLGLTLTFVTLAIPIQFKGNYITLFWAGEAVLLFWLSQKSKIATFKLGAIIVQILMLGSLIMDWEKYYSGNLMELIPFINRMFITGIVSLASLIFTYILLKKEKNNTDIFGFEFQPSSYRNIILGVCILVGYFTGMLEISYQANDYISNYYSALSYSVLYHFLFSVGIIYFVLKLQDKFWNSFIILLASINILLYIAFFYNLTYNELTENFVMNSSSRSAYFIHYILLICLAYFGYVLIKLRNESLFSKLLNHKLALWVFAFCIVYVLSNEVMIHGLMFTKDIISPAELAKYPLNKTGHSYEKEIFIDDKFEAVKVQIIKIGYPILWGVLSFVFLIIGIKKQNQPLRIIALSLLGLTIMKLFVYDIKNVSETGKIIAFILLGVLILIISFVYQKIKRLVVDEKKLSSDEILEEPIETTEKQNPNDEEIN